MGWGFGWKVAGTCVYPGAGCVYSGAASGYEDSSTSGPYGVVMIEGQTTT